MSAPTLRSRSQAFEQLVGTTAAEDGDQHHAVHELGDREDVADREIGGDEQDVVEALRSISDRTASMRRDPRSSLGLKTGPDGTKLMTWPDGTSTGMITSSRRASPSSTDDRPACLASRDAERLADRA